jgi:hypothetical protein
MLRKFILTVPIVVALILTAQPALAIHLDSVVLSATCDSYTLTVTGGIFRTLNADYVLNVTQGNGQTVTVQGTMIVPFSGTAPFSVSTSGSWGTKLAGECTATGTVTLVSYDMVPVTYWVSMDSAPVSFTCPEEKPSCDWGSWLQKIFSWVKSFFSRWRR